MTLTGNEARWILAAGLLAGLAGIGCQSDAPASRLASNDRAPGASGRSASGQQGSGRQGARPHRAEHDPLMGGQEDAGGKAPEDAASEQEEPKEEGAKEAAGDEPAEKPAEKDGTEEAKGDAPAPADEPAEKPAGVPAGEGAKEAPAPAPAARAAKKAPVVAAPRARSTGGRNPRNAQEALKDLESYRDFERDEAEYHQRLGDEAYEALDYQKAVAEYRLALDKNPALSGARERWARAALVLGIRSGEIEQVKRDFTDLDRVQKQAHLADAELGVREGDELLAKGDFANAEKKFRKVYEELLWYEFPRDIAKMREEVKEKIALAEKGKREGDRDVRSQLQKEAEARAAEAVRQDHRVTEERVQELVRKAADYIRLKDYEKAAEACQRILELKPGHRLAKFWLADMKRRQLDQKKLDVYHKLKENQELTDEGIEQSANPQNDIFEFPPPADWNHTRRRQERLEKPVLEDEEWVRKIKANLDSAKFTVAFEERPLADVLTFLSDTAAINIFTDPEIVAGELKVNLTGKDLRAQDALNQILSQTGLGYTFRDGTLFITQKEKAKGTTTFHIYTVYDVLNKIRNFEGPELQLRAKDDTGGGRRGGAGSGGGVSFGAGSAEEGEHIDPTGLIELIKEGSGGDAAWGESNNIEFHNGQLFVNATKELHAAIQTTLEKLREDSDLFVVLEARFIDINDDFLEDIGVDYRGLGVGSNFGTPFGNIINNNSTGGNDIGWVRKGSPVRDVTLIMGQDREAGRIQNIIDGFTGLSQGTRLRGGPTRSGGLTLQSTWLEPFQINVIFRAVQEASNVRQLTAPIVTAHNGQRVYVSVITQRAYIADYELVSGGTGFTIIEVADPVVQTFQEGVILDVNPVISPDKRYITLDVRPTLASLVNGIISTIRISLGSFTNVAFQVPIGVPQINLQQAFTSVTVPNGGTVLLGGFKSLSESKFISYIPILGKIPFVKNLFRRKATIDEKRSLVILVTARIADLRQDEKNRYND